MKTNFASRATFFNLRVLIGFAFCSIGLLRASAQIGGGGTTNYVPLWTGSSTLGDSAIYQSGSNVGIGTIAPIASLDVVNSTSTAIVGSTNGTLPAIVGLGSAAAGGSGVDGLTSSGSGAGVFGNATSRTGTNYGVYGQAKSPDASGVFGIALASTGTATGVEGQTQSTTGYGVYGSANKTTGISTAVAGVNFSNAGIGVSGVNNTSSGITYGVYGKSASSTGYGVYGIANSTASGTAYGVYGQSANGIGVYGVTTSTTSFPSVGVRGVANVNNVSCCTNGVEGINFSTSGNNNGVFGTTPSAGGVGGIFENTGGGLSILARVNASQNSFWVDGSGSGFFAGNLTVTGTLTKGGGSFKIDDPLDPANKYLSHSFVESPDMKNIYDGITRLDARGEAWVELPDYFEALTRDFRYQLTSVGASQPGLYIARKVKGNRFQIAGGKAGAEVSWLVTGIRKDAWANAHRIATEEDKPSEKRGTYLYPELYGASADKHAIAQH